MHLRDCGKVYYVPGVGIDTETYFPNNVIRTAKRKELGLGDNDIMIISSGDLVTRKNFGAIIEAVAEANDKKLHLFICGEGPKRDELVVTSQKLNIVDQVYLLGYRTDMCELLWAADIFVLATLQEGLSRSIMEAMACGLPCIVSDIRGNSDLIVNEVNGLLFAPNDIAGFAKGILKISNDKNMRIKMGISNLEIILDYNIESVSEKLKELYKLEISGVLQR